MYIAASSSCSFKDNGSSDVIEIDSTSLPPVAEIKQGRKDTVSIPPVPLDPAVTDKSIQLGKNVSPDQLGCRARAIRRLPRSTERTREAGCANLRFSLRVVRSFESPRQILWMAAVGP